MKIAGSCKDNEECPAVYVTDRGTIAVQGYLVDYVNTPLGEDGTYLGPELLVDADPAEYRAYRDAAVRDSTPFLAYEEALES
jgi:hypothetical protein